MAWKPSTIGGWWCWQDAVAPRPALALPICSSGRAFPKATLAFPGFSRQGWGTHFIALLAYGPGFSINYDLNITALSLFVAIVLIPAGFATASFGSARW